MHTFSFTKHNDRCVPEDEKSPPSVTTKKIKGAGLKREVDSLVALKNQAFSHYSESEGTVHAAHEMDLQPRSKRKKIKSHSHHVAKESQPQPPSNIFQIVKADFTPSPLPETPQGNFPEVRVVPRKDPAPLQLPLPQQTPGMVSNNQPSFVPQAFIAPPGQFPYPYGMPLLSVVYYPLQYQFPNVPQAPGTTQPQNPRR